MRKTNLDELNDDQLYGYMLAVHGDRGRVHLANSDSKYMKRLYESGYVTKDGNFYLFVATLIDQPVRYDFPESYKNFLEEFRSNATTYGKGTVQHNNLSNLILSRVNTGIMSDVDLCKFASLLVAIRDENLTFNPSYTPIASEKAVAKGILSMAGLKTIIDNMVEYYLFDSKKPSSLIQYYYNFKAVCS